MLFVLVTGKSVNVGLRASGTFFCLYCNAERRYQHRIWETTSHVFFVPLGSTTGECVLCLTCESAFRLECLDGNSTATCDELIMAVPTKVAHANLRFRPRTAALALAYEESGDALARTGYSGPPEMALARGRAPRPPRRH